jgi:hypothetical protein
MNLLDKAIPEEVKHQLEHASTAMDEMNTKLDRLIDLMEQLLAKDQQAQAS